VRDILKMIIVLTIIGAVSGLALSLVYEGTKTPIEYQTIKFVKRAGSKKKCSPAMTTTRLLIDKR